MINLQGIMPLIWWCISALTLLLIVCVILILLLNRRMKQFEASSVSLQTFMSGQQLDSLFDEYNKRITEQEKNFNKCTMQLTLIEEKLRVGVDRAELLRFRAFEDMGSDLSFAFALLNQEGNGVVISSIHNRDESRVYAKPINCGKSSYQLTDEEIQVINKALQGPKV